MKVILVAAAVFLVVSFCFSLVMAIPVLLCWNLAVVPATGAYEVTFWQAWGLSILISIIGARATIASK